MNGLAVQGYVSDDVKIGSLTIRVFILNSYQDKVVRSLFKLRTRIEKNKRRKS